MILVDKKIKERHTEIFSDNCYDEKYVNAVSYDLHVSGIVENDGIVKSYVLRPGEIVFIKTVEKIHMPKD